MHRRALIVLVVTLPAGGCQILLGLDEPTVANDADPNSAFDGATADASGGLDSASDGSMSDDAGTTPTCLDGENPRPVVSPETGDLVINEYLPNPSGSDEQQEWFEVRVLSDFDWNGLTVQSNAGGTLIDAPECLRFPIDEHLLFARELNPDINGGLLEVDFTFSFPLTNSGGTLAVSKEAAEFIDSTSWNTTSSGQAYALNPVDETWCEPTITYGSEGNTGTPGDTNVCP